MKRKERYAHITNRAVRVQNAGRFRVFLAACVIAVWMLATLAMSALVEWPEQPDPPQQLKQMLTGTEAVL